MYETLIRGGTVVNAGGQARADVALLAGRVAALGTDLPPGEARQVIDAGGLLVLPGLVDPHVHFNTPFMGTATRHGFDTGSVAAACGGVTTLIDFAFQERGRPALEAVRARRAEAEGRACVDYSFHAIFTEVDHRTPAQLPELIEAGIASWKVFMAYRRFGIMADDGGLLALLRASRDLPCLGIVHPENAAIIEHLVDQFLAEGKRAPRYHALSRPPLAEAEAVSRAARFAGEAGAALYAFHISSAEAVAEIQAARARGWAVYGETCPHYLCLDDSLYERPDGYNWCMSPPLRTPPHLAALWEAAANGVISIVSTDDASFDAESKAWGRDSFDRIPNGIPGVECRLALLYSEGVAKGRISVERLAALTSANPARLLGLHPAKGAIAPGADADLVLFDPAAETTLSQASSRMTAGWHPYEGWRVRGSVVSTLARGEVLVKDGRYCGPEGAGRFLKRRFDPALRQGPML
jgi:dihydropyrimidinase